MTRPFLRYGILGASGFAHRVMVPSLLATPRAQVSAVASRDRARTAPFAGLVPSIRHHGTYDGVLADPDVDVVYIPLPNAMHTPWALKAMEAGKHVLVEKPAGMAVGDIDALVAARDRTGQFCAEAFMVCHHPQWQMTRSLIADGAIGPLQHIHGHFTYAKDVSGDIRGNAALGGGSLRDIGVYPLVTARFVTGAEPTIRWARMVERDGVDITCQAHAEIAGASFEFMVSMGMAAQQEMRFFGRDGTLTLTAPFNPGSFGEARIEVRDSQGGVHIHRFPAVDQYALQAEAVWAAIQEGGDYPCPLEFSRGNQAAVDDIFAVSERSKV